ncbi:MAG: hypothetical protein ACLFP4_07760 [Spirochaetales bacterium]
MYPAFEISASSCGGGRLERDEIDPALHGSVVDGVNLVQVRLALR